MCGGLSVMGYGAWDTGAMPLARDGTREEGWWFFVVKEWVVMITSNHGVREIMAQ